MTNLTGPRMWGNGAFRSAKFLGGTWSRGIYAGTRVADGLPVLLSRCPMTISYGPKRLGYDVPGVAASFGVHRLDPPHERGDERFSTVLVEALPRGVPLQDYRGRGAPLDLIRIGCGLARSVVAACEQSTCVAGLRPETVFVEGTAGSLTFSGATPRSAVVIGKGPILAVKPAYGLDEFDADRYAPVPASAAYSVALVLWVLSQPDHPYGNHYDDSVHRAFAGERDPWLGPPEFGLILEPMLAYELAQRPSPHWMLAELEELARRWGVEVPPFPPVWPGPAVETSPYR